jgi:cytochrome c
MKALPAALLSTALFVAAGVAMYASFIAAPDRARREAAGATGGDPERGAQAIAVRGCGSCHRIEGVPGARATVGPPLDRLAFRGALPGGLPNTTPNLLRWIRFPQQVSPGTAMPDLNIPAQEARDIAAYLYSMR